MKILESPLSSSDDELERGFPTLREFTDAIIPNEKTLIDMTPVKQNKNILLTHINKSFDNFNGNNHINSASVF